MWNDPVTNTPSIVQTDFGAWGQNLPGYGEAYCGPTAMVMTQTVRPGAKDAPGEPAVTWC
jgi:hypothetical protein